MKEQIKILTVILLFLGSIALPQQSNDLLKNLQSKFNSINDLTADFSQQVNGKVILSGLFTYKKENKIKIDAGKILIVSDGSTSWNYNKNENKVIISNLDENDPGVFSIKELVYNFPEDCDVKESRENGNAVLIFLPNNYTYSFDSVKIWLNDENLIGKVLLVGAGSGSTEVEFSNYKLNQNIKDSKFSFIPPEGSKIIDLR